MKARFSLVLIFLLIATPAAVARPFTVEDMHKLSRAGNLQLSPDSRWIAFTVSRSDVEKNAMVTNLWLIQASGGSPRQLTFGSKGSNTFPRWSPDSAYLYFLSSRADDRMQIFRLPLAGGEAKQISSFKTGVNSFVLSPDGKTIAFAATVYPNCKDMKCNEEKLKKDEEKTVKAKRIKTLPVRRWDYWVDNKRSHIFVMPAEGGEAVDLTPGDIDSPIWTQGTIEYDFSPDGKEICFSRYTENESINGNSDLFTIPVAGGTPKQVTRRSETDSTPLYSPDGNWIAYSGNMNSGTYTDLTRIFLYNRKTGEVKNLTEALDRSVDSVQWSPDSKSVYINYEDQGNRTVARMDVSTLQINKLFTEGSSSDVQVAADDSFLIFSKTDISHPSEIFRLNLSPSGTTPSALTDLNSVILKDIDFGEYSSFTFDGWNNEKVQCWQVKPPGFNPQKKYPLLLLMHGGPESSWPNLFHYRWNAQLFAAPGYVVIMPNFHGSSGFGFAFMDSIKGRWNTAPYEDQMKAVDVALTWPYVDRTRVSAAGASYGGYMANWVAGQTDRFRSLVSHAGLLDVLGFTYTTDLVGWMKNETKTTIWDNLQPLIDQSPMTYAKNFKTPMLVIHGEKDFRVDPSQGFAMFQILQARGVPSEFISFPDENHWILKPANSILWYNAVLDWIDRWSSPDQKEYEKILRAAPRTTAESQS